MTKELFNARHGPSWDAFKKSPVFTDLLRVADGTASPAVQMHKMPLEQVTNNNAALLGSISGFALFRALLMELGSLPTTPEEESNFSVSIEDQFEMENPRPAVPKLRKKR